MSQKNIQVVLLGTDAKLAETISMLVRHEDCTFSLAGNYADALRAVQSGLTDIILLDLKSAETDGFNLLRQIKHHTPVKSIFTIGLATGSETPTLLRAFDIGLNENIQLPLENSLFRAQLRSAVQLKGRLEDLQTQQQEFQRRQQELTEACRLAEANSRAKSDFLATMSHEIRTPMNGVVAMAGLLMETPLTADQRGFLDTIHNSSESLLNIVNDILDFSKIEAGKMELERRPFDLRICIEEALDLLAPRVFEKPIDCGYEADDVIPELIEGDAHRVRQVLMNLLSNAVKFTERGDIFIRVKKATPPAENDTDPNALRLHFSVRDTGIGIPPDRLARLFKAFTQADVSTSRNYGGTGLGLAISRRLVELMGGKMWAESVRNDGSTFHFIINVTAAPQSEPPPYTRKQPRLADLKILILDDNAASRNLLYEQCHRWGMQPKAVENCAQALQLIRQGTAFDLALIDFSLPGMDGMAVAAEIQKLPAAAMMPMILLTPPGQDKSSEAARPVFAHTLHKPVKPARLCTVLERALLSPRIPTHTAEPVHPEVSLATQMPLRFLVVDDNEINQKVAVRLLQQLGYQPEIAGTGRAALAAIDRQPVDFIFMDVMMPDLDGLEATRLLRKRQLAGEHENYKSRIIVIAMTAHAMQGDREKCLAAGMDDYLAKPVRPKDVRDMIEKWGGKILAKSPTAQISPPTAASEEAPVDMDRMKDLTDGNMTNLCELVELYLRQTHKQFTQMATAINEGNTDAVRRLAHSCAGASATLGMTQLVPKLRQLEKLGTSGTLTGAGQICEDGRCEFNRIREFLQLQPGLTETVAKCFEA